MNKVEQRDSDLEQSEAALRRAGRKARELAERTRTPLVTYKDGKVWKQLAVRESEADGYGKTRKDTP